MKLAILSDQFSLRNDVSRLIQAFKKKCDVVVICHKDEVAHVAKDVTTRVVDRTVPSKKDRIWAKIYQIFGNLPKSKQDYKKYNLRRIEKTPDAAGKKKLKLLLKLQFLFPRLISYSGYINKLTGDKKQLEDIDCFLFFSDIISDQLFAAAIQSGKPVYVFVYSWDHVMKFRRFPKKNITYLAWNQEIAKDLKGLHGVAEDIVKTVGASQFCSIHDYFESQQTPETKEKYLYFVASMGYPIMARQEVEIVMFLSETLARLDSEVKIVFRCYPNLLQTDIYDKLKNAPNIEFDTYTSKDKIKLTNEDINEKFLKVEKALAVVHAGTTVGLEASYFNTPVIYLTPEDLAMGVDESNLSHLNHIWAAYHLVKYYRKAEFENVVLKKAQLESVLAKLLSSPQSLMAYNEDLRKTSDLKSVEALVGDVSNILFDHKK